MLAAGLERFPDDPVLIYDLACYESMAGRGEDALGHLRQAVELDGSLKDGRGGGDERRSRSTCEAKSTSSQSLDS